MTRPKTKEDLVILANQQFAKLWQQIDLIADDLSDIEFQWDEAFLNNHQEQHWTRDKNLRDVLIHLHEWHQLLLIWIQANQNGETQDFLPEPYNWRTYGIMNQKLWEQHQNTDYEHAKAMLKQSHHQVMQIIEKFSNEELFIAKYFSWTGSTTLGSYCISATSSHYEWALKKIKQYFKVSQVNELK